MKLRPLLNLLLVAVAFLAACAPRPDARATLSDRRSESAAPRAGHLLIIGGGLDDDNKPVYERFIALARAGTSNAEPPRILIATAASADQAVNAKGKTQSIRAYCPSCQIDVITRETPRDETVALVDRAQAMFFTGGDQKRITTRYRPDGRDTPEAAAMRRLLARGGTIAGTSAGDAMMSDPMFLTGRSAEALGFRSTRTERAADDDADEKRPLPPLGPQIGTGMGFLPWAITDSHFFERHRFGRLVAALEASRVRLGIGVGEDACAEVDLSSGEVVGISVADSLLVDAGGLTRDGMTRRNIRARVITQGTRLSLINLLRTQTATPAARPASTDPIPVVEPGQNRQLASWRFFLRAQDPGTTAAPRLDLDGYSQTAWPDGKGWSVVEIGPHEAQATTTHHTQGAAPAR